MEFNKTDMSSKPKNTMSIGSVSYFFILI